MGTYPLIPPSLSTERLLTVEMVTVVAPTHSLAQHHSPIPLEEAEVQIQLVLTDRSELTQGVDLGVQSTNTWRLSDLGAKQAFLIAGLGWGHVPRPMIADDLAAGRLVQITLEGPGAGLLPMHAIYKADLLPGPAARWMLDRIRSSA